MYGMPVIPQNSHSTFRLLLALKKQTVYWEKVDLMLRPMARRLQV
jgi:hypothetical protein